MGERVRGGEGAVSECDCERSRTILYCQQYESTEKDGVGNSLAGCSYSGEDDGVDQRTGGESWYVDAERFPSPTKLHYLACLRNLRRPELNLYTDVDHFGPDAATFNPERWLGSSEEKSYAEKPTPGLAHHSFGAGSRSCPGSIIASKLIYAALFRLLSLYKIEASETEPPNTDYVEYNAIKTALVAIPRDFKVKLVPRGQNESEVLKQGEERTKGYYRE